MSDIKYNRIDEDLQQKIISNRESHWINPYAFKEEIHLPPIRSKLKLAPFCFAGIKEKASAKTITALAPASMFTCRSAPECRLFDCYR